MTGKKGCNAPVFVTARHASAEAISKLVAISYQPSVIGYPLTADY